MEEVEAPVTTTKKAGKRTHKHHHSSSGASTKSRPNSNSGRSQIPPSFTNKAQSPPAHKASSRHHERFSGLWEWYYDDEGGGTGEGAGEVHEGDALPHGDDSSHLKNIRGFLMKRRKSPLKGWLKRYCVVEKGVLYISRSFTQMVKGKVSGTLDLGLAFIHCDGTSRKINIDGDNQVLHLKTKNASHFAAWSSSLISHEMYRKTQIASGKSMESKSFASGHSHHLTGVGLPSSKAASGIEEWAGKTQLIISGIKKDLEGIHESLEVMSLHVRSPRGSGILNVPSSSSAGTIIGVSEKLFMESMSDTSSVQTGTSSGNDSIKAPSEGPGSTNTKKKPKKSRKDKKKDSSSNISPDQIANPPNCVTLEEPLPVSLSVSDISVREDFTAIAKLVYAQFYEVMERLEKLDGGLQQAVKQDLSHQNKQEAIISNQLLLLHQTMAQNTELRDRLSQIQSIATGTESKVHISTPVGGKPHRTPNPQYQRGSSIPRFDSYMSLQSSLSEKFFDALDQVHEFSSSEDEVENSEDEESGDESDSDMFTSLTHNVLSSLSITPTTHKPSTVLNARIAEEEEDIAQNLSSLGEEGISQKPSTVRAAEEDESSASPDLQPQDQLYERPPDQTHQQSHDLPSDQKGVSQRRKLPAPIPDMADFSLWSLLRKNIGKDLSKISMPVSMNEPLSALQRLCEELEYSQLLDQAASCQDPFDRMVYVACFAVSSYALSYYRAGRKPFNPILGETYEFIQENIGLKFIAEQVSHHPPIAACHCVSPNFEFWQDARIKSKFWGKSMEVFPIGVTNIKLPKYDDHYQWRKVTSCIHNVFGGQRWVDQYGEMAITNKDRCTCKLTFVKAGYWSSKRHVVYGDVYDAEGAKVRHLFGAWNEAMFCGEENEEAQCIWRAAEMPSNNEEYYGFSYFAIGLNELLEKQKDELPCTDCRFRPDQRLLENGCVQEADAEKRRVEQIQRESRAERERLGEEWTPNFFSKVEDENGGQETWVTNQTYWNLRENGFKDIELPSLW